MLLPIVIAVTWNPAIGIPLLIVGMMLLILIYVLDRYPREQGHRRWPWRRASKFDRDSYPSEMDLDIAASNPDEDELDTAMSHLKTSVLSRATTLIVDTLQGARLHPDTTNPDVEPLLTPESSATHREASSDAMPEGTSSPRRVVSLFVVAHDGKGFQGTDILAAAARIGMEYGAWKIYHRLVDGKADLGAIFSMANMIEPGYFEPAQMASLHTPGVSVFMTLPNPLPARDAWDAMLPATQRLAELLDGNILDEDRHPLGAARIASICHELQRWDESH